MVSKFMIKRGKEISGSVVAVLCFIIILYTQTRILSIQVQDLLVIPIMLILSTAILVNLIMQFRWFFSFAVFLDMEKQEVILNHTLFFIKKRILLKDIKEIDTLNGTIILFGSTPLSKLQKIVSKTKKSSDYTIRFEAIETSERRELIKLLITAKNEE